MKILFIVIYLFQGPIISLVTSKFTGLSRKLHLKLLTRLIAIKTKGNYVILCCCQQAQAHGKIFIWKIIVNQFVLESFWDIQSKSETVTIRTNFEKQQTWLEIIKRYIFNLKWWGWQGRIKRMKCSKTSWKASDKLER